MKMWVDYWGGGGAKGMLATLSSYWGGAWSPVPPLFLRLCTGHMNKDTGQTNMDRQTANIPTSNNPDFEGMMNRIYPSELQ